MEEEDDDVAESGGMVDWWMRRGGGEEEKEDIVDRTGKVEVENAETVGTRRSIDIVAAVAIFLHLLDCRIKERFRLAVQC
jgi:hypothetical protein